MVIATDHVLPPAPQPDAETLATVGIIAEILPYHDIAEIAPVAEETSASAQSYSPRRRVTGLNGFYIRISDHSGTRHEPAYPHTIGISPNTHRTIKKPRECGHDRHDHQQWKGMGITPDRNDPNTESRHNHKRNDDAVPTVVNFSFHKHKHKP